MKKVLDGADYIRYTIYMRSESVQPEKESAMKEYIVVFFAGYQDAALFSSCDNNDNPLDKNYNISDFSDDTNAKMKSDCETFVEQGWEWLESVEALRAGRDFWFNRNGHGCGFWDGDYSTNVGEALDKLSHEFGPYDLYISDDNLIIGG